MSPHPLRRQNSANASSAGAARTESKLHTPIVTGMWAMSVDFM
jgi:hypothetical protein